MQNRIVLISDDFEFFNYISPKLSLRKSDELYRFSYDELPEKSHLLMSSLLIINSEGMQEKTLELLNIMEGAVCLVFCFNDDEEYRIKLYKAGVYGYITLMTTDAEIEAKVTQGLNIVSTIEKNNMYREILVNNNLVTKNNEVFLDYNNVLSQELEKIAQTSTAAVLAAISPNEKSKFLLKPNQIETAILNNIRKNDVLMNYAANKYFLLLHNTTLDSAKKIWEKIQTKIPEKIYAGFASTGLKSREQIVNEALNKLHESINRDYIINPAREKDVIGSNFKLFRQEFNKKLEQIISPAFYHIQQKYNEKIYGTSIGQGIGEGYGVLYINSKYASGSFRITSPGFSKINIDITYKANSANLNGKKQFPQEKRINLEPEELEEGLLEDLLEQFIMEFTREVNDEFNK